MRVMSKICKAIVESRFFNRFILIIILLAGVIVGLQTYPSLEDQYGNILQWLDWTVLSIFILEVIIKMAAHGRQPWNYFRDPWNIFDFIIVAACLIPTGSGSLVAVLRLARVLRVLRLVTALPRLRVLVGAVLRSIPSIGYVFLLAILLFYIYGCMGTFLFAKNDPLHFRNLQNSMLSLYRVVTFEAWTEILYINMYGSDVYGYGEEAYRTLAFVGVMKEDIVPSASPLASVFFFITFTLTGAMILLNLFVGVMLTALDETRRELELEVAMQKLESDQNDPEIQEELLDLQKQLQDMSNSLGLRLQLLSRKADENSARLQSLLSKRKDEGK